MRLLVLATTFPRHAADTIPRFVADLGNAMADVGHEVTVVAPHYRGAAMRERLGSLDVHRFAYFWPPRWERVAYGGGILHNVRTDPLALAQVPAFVAMMKLASSSVASRFRPDLVHSHWIIPSGLVGASVASHRGCPHAITLHSGDVSGLERIPGGSFLASRLARRSGLILPVSNSVKARFLALLDKDTRALVQGRFRVVPMGVDVASFQTPPAGSTRHEILAIGRLVEKKGFGVLVDALRLLRDRGRALPATICGDGPLRSRLEEATVRAGLREWITFRGVVSEQEKRALLQRRPILAVPSLVPPSGDAEGLPVVVLEGLAAGCAVVASRSGGIEDALTDGSNGILTPAGDAHALADAIAHLVDHPQQRVEMSANARASAAAYDWREIARRYDEAFRSIGGPR